MFYIEFVLSCVPVPVSASAYTFIFVKRIYLYRMCSLMCVYIDVSVSNVFYIECVLSCVKCICMFSMWMCSYVGVYVCVNGQKQ
jgi:hypothetical protein